MFSFVGLRHERKQRDKKDCKKERYRYRAEIIHYLQQGNFSAQYGRKYNIEFNKTVEINKDRESGYNYAEKVV